MIEIYEEENTPVKAFLVGFLDKNKSEEYSLAELKGLVKTLGMEVGGEIVITRVDPNPQYFLGTGKVQEILEQVEETESECIIFDFEISPTHQRGQFQSLRSQTVYLNSLNLELNIQQNLCLYQLL